MIHYLVAFALLLHVLFWGAGVALLVMPRRWQRFWPVLAFPAGMALQSAVVWIAAHLGLRGTNAYAWWSEFIPLYLAVEALVRRGCKPAWVDISRIGLVWAAVAGCLALLVLPVAIASSGLTSLSLGSCDAADYAAGARVLMEFASDDRSGFLGLTEVVRVHSVNNFYDYWLRLNHFTPAALMALNGSVFDCAPHETATLMTAVLLAGMLPVVFWVARTIVGYSGGVSLIVAAVFGISPVMWYAVAHVSPGQLIAAPAIALLTWSGVALWRNRLTRRAAWSFSGVLFTAYWLILGSYNFILLVALVPAVAYAGGLAVWRRQWVRLAWWSLAMLAPLGVCGLVFGTRVAGLAERFSLLQAFDFGWKIPPLTAEGWLGMVSGGNLEPWSAFGLRWLLCAAVVGLLAWAFLRAGLQRRRAVWAALSISLPVLGGYFFLQIRGARLDTNASYDAYKLFAVFYPLLLPVFFWWVTLRRSRKLHEWLFVWSVAGVVIAFNVVSCGMFIWKMSRPPLIVDGELRQLRRIEAMPDVASVNLLIPDMWSRLWANAFLLRKAQFFQTHTYEARRNTPLNGEWDLEGGSIAVMLPDSARREINRRFALVHTKHPEFVRLEPGEGWFDAETLPSDTERWQWTAPNATVRLLNPHPYPLGLTASIDGWSPLARHVSFVRGGGEQRPPVRIAAERAHTKLPVLGVPPGGSVLVLRSDEPPFTAEGDPRPLGVSIFRLRVTPRR
jgi:hypothetical protein